MTLEAPPAGDWGGIAVVVGAITATITAMAGLLFGVGRGVQWLVGTADKRKRWIDEAVRAHLSGIEARLAAAEARADRLEREKSQIYAAFQMLANELQRLDPTSTILLRATALLTAAFPVPQNPPDAIRDLLSELHRKTGGEE